MPENHSSSEFKDDTSASNEAVEVVPPAPIGGEKPLEGSQAWLQVLGSWVLIFNTWGTMITFGDYQTFYESGEIFEASSAGISWIGSLQSLMVFLTGALVGPIYDRGYLRSLLLVGSFCMVFGHMMLSLCHEYWQVVLAQGFVVGLGGGCLFVPSLAIVQQYFSRHLGLAVGIVATGSSIGGVIYPVIFTNLIDSIGFPWTVRVIGFVALATLFVPLSVSRMRSTPPTTRKLLDLTTFTDGPFMVCVLACFLGYAGNYMAFFYTSFFGSANGWMSAQLALYLVPILNAASAFGRVLPNWLADHIGPINVAIPGSLLLAVILLSNLAVQSAAGVICTALAFGVMSGIFIATPPLMFMRLTEDKAKLGTRMGMAYALVGISVVIGGPGSGGVLQHDPSYLDWTAAWGFAGGLQLAACVVFCMLRLWKGGLRMKVKV